MLRIKYQTIIIRRLMIGVAADGTHLIQTDNLQNRTIRRSISRRMTIVLSKLIYIDKCFASIFFFLEKISRESWKNLN